MFQRISHGNDTTLFDEGNLCRNSTFLMFACVIMYNKPVETQMVHWSTT